MACPRCGGGLTTLTLEGVESVFCEACEYVGVSTDFHTPPRAAAESWEEAFDRFRDQES